MFVAILFIPVVAGNIFLESELRRLPKISERNKPSGKTHMLFDPCYVKTADKNKTCAQLRRQGMTETTQYDLPLQKEFLVWCDMKTDGGGWTVIQRRSFAETGNEFDRSPDEYNKGFHHTHNPSYWIGNEIIHELTTNPYRNQVLKVELTTEEEKKIIVDYKIFRVGSKNEDYKLTIDGYSSPNGSDYDALAYHNEGKFITTNGLHLEEPCQRSRISGGWWIATKDGCYKSNLNGRKKPRGLTKNEKDMYIFWYKQNDRNSYKTNYKHVEMKIRDADYKFCAGEMAK